MPDIDIDFANRDAILSKIKHRVAKLNTGKKHNTGVYVTEIPHNPFNELSTIDHKVADARGYFKLDFLNVSIYKNVKNEQHLTELMERKPIWQLLEHEDFSEKVFHLNGHSALLKQLKPSSVQQLAASLAIIRPAKRYLVNESWETILKEVWIKPTDGAYFFKKAHAFSYAMAVCVHMNLICDEFTL
jgi:glucan-binding YG repeat protein|tara:strand:- start:2819 stop:3379 length:561 start_codon:yes stop_codon:yes gene_type:complete